MGIGERIHLARRISGLSQQALAERVGVSKTAICKYEKNRDVPSSGVLLRLAKALDVKLEFFLRPLLVQEIRPVLPTGHPPTGKAEAAVIGRIQEWLERYLETEALLAEETPPTGLRFELPLGFPYPVRSLSEAATAAGVLRDVWRLGRGPIEDLTELLEQHGIKVGLVGAPDVLGTSVFWAEADRLVPVIVMRKDMPGDQQRFRMAHALAYLVLDFPADWGELQVENAAHRFASSFLVPEEAARAELGPRRRTISLYELHMLKHKYGVGIRLWLSRAQDLEILRGEDAGRLLQPFEREGLYHTREPGDDFPPEQPTRMERLVMRALSEELISERRASELLGRSFAQFSLEVAKEHGGLPVGVHG